MKIGSEEGLSRMGQLKPNLKFKLTPSPLIFDTATRNAKAGGEIKGWKDSRSQLRGPLFVITSSIQGHFRRQCVIYNHGRCAGGGRSPIPGVLGGVHSERERAALVVVRCNKKQNRSWVLVRWRMTDRSWRKSHSALENDGQKSG